MTETFYSVLGVDGDERARYDRLGHGPYVDEYVASDLRSGDGRESRALRESIKIQQPD